MLLRARLFGGISLSSNQVGRARFDSGDGVLRIDVSSVHLHQTLTAFETDTGEVIGSLFPKFEFGFFSGKWRGEFSWPVNPGHVTVVSSMGGLVTLAVEGN